jgi:hypothetical protein
MIEYTLGDLLKSDAEALVNPVNCAGVMGAGLAAQFRRAYPKNFRAYQGACLLGYVHPGALFIFEGLPCIINFPTKRHWREPSRIEDIEAGLITLDETIRTRKLKVRGRAGLGLRTGRACLARRETPDRGPLARRGPHYCL